MFCFYNVFLHTPVNRKSMPIVDALFYVAVCLNEPAFRIILCFSFCGV